MVNSRPISKTAPGICRTFMPACSISLLFFLLLPLTCLADSAETLPKGVFSFGLDSRFYLPTTEKFNDAGGVEDAARYYNANLNSSVFKGLKAFEKSSFGLSAGQATVGNSIVSYEYQANYFDFSLQYGITDNLTLGVLVPYWQQSNSVKAELDSSTATIGKNTYLNTLLPLNYKLPSGVPRTVPLTTKDVIDLLGKGLDINKDGKIDVQGYGYREFGSWSDNGFSDVRAGLRYKYLQTKNWRFAGTGGIRFPTGTVDNDDDLTDLKFGSGAWGLFVQLQNDFIGVKDLLLNGTFRYEWVLPDDRTLRIPESADQPISAVRADVNRDQGDVFEFETSANYQFLEGVSFGLLYRYGFTLETQATGDNGQHFQSLEDKTAVSEQVVIASLNFSTIPLYRAKKFPLPLSWSFSYRNRFAGRNTLKTQYLGLSVLFYF